MNNLAHLMRSNWICWLPSRDTVHLCTRCLAFLRKGGSHLVAQMAQSGCGAQLFVVAQTIALVPQMTVTITADPQQTEHNKLSSPTAE